MEPRIGSKLKILYIIDILKKYSDEDHPITATEICEHLSKYGIAAERKAIYSDIENLIFYGFDIIKTRSPRAGFFMGARELELPELYLLIDAVQAANFITPKKTRELVKKLEIMNVWRTGFIVMTIGFIPLFFVNTLPLAIVIAAFMGAGIAACLTTMDCIGAKIVDDDYRRHGIKREGIINSLMGVMNRLNGLYISLAFFLTARLVDFQSGDDPGENPAMAARFLLCVFPAVAMAVASVVTFFLKFPKDEKEND